MESDVPEPTPVPTLGPPWSPASTADTALADRLLETWTDNDADAVEQVYDVGSHMVLGWEPAVHYGLEEIARSVAGTPNTYTRVSGVTITTQQVAGLRPLPPGGRFLHFVTQIHGSLFDIVLAVNDADKTVVHWAYEYEAGDVRVRDGFPAIPTPQPSVP